MNKSEFENNLVALKKEYFEMVAIADEANEFGYDLTPEFESELIALSRLIKMMGGF